MRIRITFEKIYIVVQMLLLFVFSFFYRTTNSFIIATVIINSIMLLYFYRIPNYRLRKKEFITIVGVFLLIFFHYATNNLFLSNEIFILLALVTYTMIFYRLFSRGYFLFFAKQIRLFAIILGIYGLIEIILKQNILYDSLFGEYAFASVSYILKISFGEPLIVAFVYSIVILIIATLTERKKTGYFFSLILCLIISMLTEKRTGMFLSIMGLVLIESLPYLINESLIFTKKRLLKWFGFVAIIVGASLIIPVEEQNLMSFFINKISELFNDSSGGYMSVYHRASAIKLGMDYYWNSDLLTILFGGGYKSLYQYLSMNAISITKEGFYVIDNTYVSGLNDFGIIPVGFVVVTCIYMLFNLLLNIVKEKDKVFLKLDVSAFLLLLFCIVFLFFFDGLNWFPGIFFLSMTIGFSRYVLNSTNKFRRI